MVISGLSSVFHVIPLLLAKTSPTVKKSSSSQYFLCQSIRGQISHFLLYQTYNITIILSFLINLQTEPQDILWDVRFILCLHDATPIFGHPEARSRDRGCSGNTWSSGGLVKVEFFLTVPVIIYLTENNTRSFSIVIT